MEVDVNKEGSGSRNTDRNKMRERKKEIRKYEKKREKERTLGGGGERGGRRQNETNRGRHGKMQELNGERKKIFQG